MNLRCQFSKHNSGAANNNVDVAPFGTGGSWWGSTPSMRQSPSRDGVASNHEHESERPGTTNANDKIGSLRKSSSLDAFLQSSGPKLKDMKGLPNSKRQLKRLRKQRLKARTAVSLPSIRQSPQQRAIAGLELSDESVAEAFAYTDKLRINMASESLMQSSSASHGLSASASYASNYGMGAPLSSAHGSRRKLKKKSSGKRSWKQPSTSKEKGRKGRFSVPDLVDNFERGVNLQHLRAQLEESRRSMDDSSSYLASAMKNWVAM